MREIRLYGSVGGEAKAFPVITMMNRYILFVIFLISSCAQALPHKGEIHITATPYKLNVHSGSEDKIFVKLSDRQGRPLTGVKIEAESTSLTVATVTPESLTDTEGRAIFIVKGISPGTTNIILSALEYRTTVEVVFVEH